MEVSRKTPKRVSSWHVDKANLLCLTNHTIMANGSKTYLMVRGCINSPMEATTKANSSKAENKDRANSQHVKGI